MNESQAQDINIASIPFRGRAADLILSARERTSLSQNEAAQVIGIPPSMLSKYERGVQEPTVPTLLRIIESLGCGLEMELVLAVQFVPCLAPSPNDGKPCVHRSARIGARCLYHESDRFTSEHRVAMAREQVQWVKEQRDPS